MRQQDGDQGRGFPGRRHRGSGCIPIALMRLRERPRALACASWSRRAAPGFGLEDLEVVIQAEHLDVASDRSFMSGHQSGAVVDLDGPGSQPHREASPGVTGRDGVEALPHRYSGPVVDPGLQ